jgi:acetyl esterase/lipase
MPTQSELPRTKSRRSLIALSVLGVSLMAVAAGCAVPRPPSGSSQAVPPRGAVQAVPTVSGVAYGPLPEQRLDVHLPTAGAGPFPVLVYVHGGGWIAGTRAEVPDVLSAQVDRGIALVSIDYRLVRIAPDGTSVNGFPVPDTDVDRAIRFVKARASTWGLDPRRVMLAGESAGGHLATLAAAAPGAFVDPTLPRELAVVSPRVQGVLDFAGITDFTTFGAVGGWATRLMSAFLGCPDGRIELCDPANVTAASVATHLDAGAPPAFLAYGGSDELVVSATQGIPLALAWSRARGDGGTQPPWARGVYFQQTNGGDDIDISGLNVTTMQGWIDRNFAATKGSAQR